MISVIEGLDKLKYLRHLNLSYNEIECIENLNHMRLQTLHLKNNKIYKFEEGDDVGFKTLNDLVYVVLGYNNLRSLKLFRGAGNIQEINMIANNLGSLIEVNYLRDLIYLTKVDFRQNPITCMNNYYAVCIDCMKHLCILDGNLIDPWEKVSFMFNESKNSVEQRFPIF